MRRLGEISPALYESAVSAMNQYGKDSLSFEDALQVKAASLAACQHGRPSAGYNTAAVVFMADSWAAGLFWADKHRRTSSAGQPGTGGWAGESLRQYLSRAPAPGAAPAARKALPGHSTSVASTCHACWPRCLSWPAGPSAGSASPAGHALPRGPSP